MSISFVFLKESFKKVIRCLSVSFLLIALMFLFLNKYANDGARAKTSVVSVNKIDKQNVKVPSKPLTTKSIKCEPGKRTIKNFLSTAISRVGSALYIFGGGWGEDSHKIGPNKRMEDFLKSQDSSYLFLDTKETKLPNNFDCSEASKIGKEKFLQSIGIDCAGFVGWSIYNTLHSESDVPVIRINGRKKGVYAVSPDSTYVCDFMRADLEKRSILKFFKMNVQNVSQITPGDILTGLGHIWIVVGVCSDKSMVVVHSSSVDIESGVGRGGIMISGTETPEGKRESEALKLATTYMSKYFPEYHEKFKNYSAKENLDWKPNIKIFCPFYSKGKKYLVPGLEGDKYIGKWQVLSDNDNIKSKSCEEIFKILFEE